MASINFDNWIRIITGGGIAHQPGQCENRYMLPLCEEMGYCPMKSMKMIIL